MHRELTAQPVTLSLLLTCNHDNTTDASCQGTQFNLYQIFLNKEEWRVTQLCVLGYSEAGSLSGAVPVAGHLIQLLLL